MKVQTKILLLLLLIAATFAGSLAAFEWIERKYEAIVDANSSALAPLFDEFLRVRGDDLKMIVEDSTVWDEMVRALVQQDSPWAEQHFSDETLATNQVNAVWIYKPDLSLLFSRNNRYATNLHELPLSREAFGRLFEKERTCHFYLEVPQGWMEIRGATVHPSRDAFRETKPQGFFFAGHIWTREDIRRMSRFSGYSIEIVPPSGVIVPGTKKLGRSIFSRTLFGWDGHPVAKIGVENDWPIIRDLNQAMERIFIGLLLFAAALLFIVSVLLVRWIFHPIRLISRELEKEDPSGIEPLRHQEDEFGKLAELIFSYRRTQEKLQRAEEELRHAQKLEAIGRLAGGVAHDFNNLLTAIIGYSELLERQLAGDEKALGHARLIHKAGDQAASLTKQLLAFSRKQLLQPKVLDLNSLIDEMKELLRRVIGEHIIIQIVTAANDAKGPR